MILLEVEVRGLVKKLLIIWFVFVGQCSIFMTPLSIYCFTKKYLDDGVMKIEQCPTKQMISDILTSSLIMIGTAENVAGPGHHRKQGPPSPCDIGQIRNESHQER